MATMNFRVEDDLKVQFEQATTHQDKNCAQVLRQFMRDYVQQARNNREYETWLLKKVRASLAQVAEGKVIPNDEMKARSAARREQLLGRKA